MTRTQRSMTLLVRTVILAMMLHLVTIMLWPGSTLATAGWILQMIAMTAASAGYAWTIAEELLGTWDGGRAVQPHTPSSRRPVTKGPEDRWREILAVVPPEHRHRVIEHRNGWKAYVRASDVSTDLDDMDLRATMTGSLTATARKAARAMESARTDAERAIATSAILSVTQEIADACERRRLDLARSALDLIVEEKRHITTRTRASQEPFALVAAS